MIDNLRRSLATQFIVELKLLTCIGMRRSNRNDVLYDALKEKWM